MTLPLKNREDDREDDKGGRSPIAETDSSRSPKRDSKTESGQEGLKLIHSDTSSAEVGGLANSTGGEVEVTPLFPSNELRELQSRWDRIQTGFVDQPRNAVNEADALVSSAMQRLTE